ncbi:MAG: GAF domain-containing protein, partial [Planctomycetes bacterium]|nr:GAF domain-containing protein [Planctomycetota bacterium]
MDDTMIEQMPSKLTEFVDVTILQQIQDWFAATTGVATVIRDVDGRLVTKPSHANKFCSLITGQTQGRERCRESNHQAAVKAAQTGRPVKYECHAGLTQFAAPIQIKGQWFGTIVMGDRPQTPLTPEAVRKLAAQTQADPDKLMEAARGLQPWSEEDMQQAITFMHSIANTLAQLCYQGMQLRQSVHEMTTLYEVSRLLTSTVHLDEVLTLIVKTVTGVLGVKACSLRLIDEKGDELTIAAVHNLSRKYLDKGPVRLSESLIDRAALRGEAVYVPDLTKDPRVLYPKEAQEEGLCSGLSVGLISKGKPIGAIHIYTGEPRQFSRDEVRLFRLLANQAAVAIDNARLHREHELRDQLERELAVAGQIQAQLLPRECPPTPGYDIKARSIPSRQVGGDFYDFVPLANDHLGIAIGDVSGKSVSGAILMAAARSALRAQIDYMYATRDIIARTNRSLCRDTRPTEFVSLFYGALDMQNRRFTYSNAGHNPPLLFRGSQEIPLEKGGPILGTLDDATFEEATI